MSEPVSLVNTPQQGRLHALRIKDVSCLVSTDESQLSNPNTPKFLVLTGVDTHFSRKRACVFNWLLKKSEFNAISQIMVD